MSATAESVLADVKQRKFAPVYFLQGEETFYIDQIADLIEATALTEAEKGFNQTIMYGRDATIAAILNNARRFPMMADKQVVIVKEAQSITDINKEDSAKLLLDYLNKPVPTTILVFCHKNKTLDKRKSLGKAIDKLTVCVTTKKLYDNQVPAWIEAYIKSKGFTITHKATQMLSEAIGNNLERLANEIAKVTINLADSKQIDEVLIQKNVGISKDYNVFELQKALITKDVLKANKIVHYFESNASRNPIIPIVANIFSFYSKLLVAIHAKDKSPKGLASALKINPYFVQDYTMALKNYSLVQVVNAIHYVRDADMKSKGVGQNNAGGSGQILKELVFKLLH